MDTSKTGVSSTALHRLVVPTRALLIALFCAAAASVLPTATASARPLYGVQGISPFQSATSMTRDLDTVARSHSRVLRVQAFWAVMEPQAGQYNADAVAGMDRLIDGAAARKIKVILFADGTPCWASAAPGSLRGDCSGETKPSVYRYPPRDPAAFTSFSTFLVQRYGAKLAAYQIWNEPDQQNELYWAGPDKVKRYVEMVKAAYGPLKAAAPNVPVLAGSFVGTNGRWLTALYDAGMKGSYDGLAVHFYDLPLYGLSNTRAVQKAHGDTTPLWLTEFGWSSCYAKKGPAIIAEHACVTRAGQRRNITDTFQAVSGKSWVKAAVVYHLHDENSAYQFGLLDTRNRVKTAFDGVRRLLAGKRMGSIPRAKLRLTVQRGRLVASGSASQIDTFELKLTQNGRWRYRSTIRTDRFGRYRVTFPASLPTSGIRVSIRSAWDGRSASAAR
jgi:hypothetical protein